MSGFAAMPSTGQDEICSRDNFFWEDFKVGQIFTFGQHEVSREDIITFARQFDPQPVHINEQAAKFTMLRGLAASGWHSCAIFMSMLQDGLLSRSRFAGTHEIEKIKWVAPVRPGDVLSGHVTCVGIAPVTGQPHLGLCSFDCETLNGSGHKVMSWRAHMYFERRGGEDCSSGVSPKPDRGSTVVRIQNDNALNFFEHVSLGDEIALGSYTFSAERIKAFNQVYGPHPAHFETKPGQLSASGFHVTGAWMRRLIRYYLHEGQKRRAAGYSVPQLGPSPGIKHLKWHSPVHAGDVLTFKCWAERKVEATSKAGWGLLHAGSEIYNQHGEVVVSFFAQLFLERAQRTLGKTNA